MFCKNCRYPEELRDARKKLQKGHCQAGVQCRWFPTPTYITLPAAVVSECPGWGYNRQMSFNQALRDILSVQSRYDTSD